MRPSATFIGIIVSSTLLAAAGEAPAPPSAPPTFRLTGEVVDAATGKPVAARLYISDARGTWFFARSAAPGGSAIRYEKKSSVNPLSVELHTTLSAHPFEVDLPAGMYTLEVERGKEYRTLARTVEVAGGPVTVKLALERWIDLGARGWYSGDTHVHRSVDELPALQLAEDLNVTFPLVWWVTKDATPPAKGDKTSAVPAAELAEIDPTHVISTRNTEYEIFSVGGKSHTLGAFFALNHGAALEAGAPPVRAIAEEAHRRGALLDLEKHDWPWSIALVPVMQVDLFELANNHLWRTEFAYKNWSTPGAAYMGLPDQARTGGERQWILYGLDTYYALLDCGFRLRPAAGTASGVHPVPLGFSRVYVHLDGPFTFKDWYRGLSEGRSFATTGPMLFAKVNGQDPGHVFKEGSPATFEVQGAAVSETPIRKLEIVANGKVVRQIEIEVRKSAEGAAESRFDEKVQLERSGWLAVRAFEERPGGRMRFAHSGPVWIEMPGRPLRPSRAEAEFLLRRVTDEIKRSSGVVPPAALEEYEKARQFYEGILKGLPAERK
jgi:hypothetical protein